MNPQRVERSITPPWCQPICRNYHVFLQHMYRIRPQQEEMEGDKYSSTQEDNESIIATLVFI